MTMTFDIAATQYTEPEARIEVLVFSLAASKLEREGRRIKGN